MPDLDYIPDPRGLGWIYYESMLKHKGKIAQIDGLTGKSETYGSLLERVIRTSIALQKRGLKPGDFISICTYNHLDSAIPHISSCFISVIMAAVDPLFTAEEMASLLKPIMPKIIFVVPEKVNVVENTLQEIGSNAEIVVFGRTSKHTPFSEFLQPTSKENNFRPTEARSLEDTAMVFFTSGTSGLPKAVCHSHYGLMCQQINRVSMGHDQSLALAYASPYWTVFMSIVGSAILSGGSRLVFPKFDPNAAWKPFEYKLTEMFLNSYQVLTMCAQGRPKNISLSNIQHFCVGGEYLNSNQIAQIQQTFPETHIYIIYGQTELPGSAVNFNIKDAELAYKKPTSAGKPLPGISYKIINLETGDTMGPNQSGELRLKTKFYLKGYLNTDSSEVWDSEGWLKTGDIAYYDEDYCFYILGRCKEMFKFRGWHVVPAITESVLLTHPDVEKAMVVGVPHKTEDNHPLGIITLKSTSKTITAKEIEKYVNERVSDYQRLRAGVKIVDKLPLTASGKINRNLIKELVIRGEL